MRSQMLGKFLVGYKPTLRGVSCQNSERMLSSNQHSYTRTYFEPFSWCLGKLAMNACPRDGYNHFFTESYGSPIFEQALC
jgi:hypothetical protein